MPEGPEVACVRDALKQTMLNKTIVVFEHTSHKFYTDLSEISIGSVITDVSCYGKKLMIEFDNDYTLFNSLGRFGDWSIDTKPNSVRLKFGIGRIEKYDDYEVAIIERYIYYGDTKGEGRFEYTKTVNKQQRLRSIGPDILQEKLTLEDFIIRFDRVQKKYLIDVLLDQSLISGIGNYLRTDICHHAKLHPFRTIESLSDDDWQVLYESVYHIVNEAYQNNGCTLGTFVTPTREKGSYVRRIDPKKKKDILEQEYVTGKCSEGRTILWVEDYQL